MMIVKSVISGDTVVLRGRAVNGPPPEKLISLHYIAAPRKDDRFYFEAKDFLRKHLIGKNVDFTVVYKTTREVGNLLLNGQNVAKEIVRNGWATVKAGSDSKDSDELYAELLELEKAAKMEKLGIFSESMSPRIISNTSTIEAKAFLEKYKGKEIPGIIETVKDASTFRILLFLDDSNLMITLSLAGVKTPILRKGIPNVPDLVEPFAEESKFMVESRLGQRDVHVLLQGLPSNPSPIGAAYPLFIGTIVFPLGNISELLLNEGFAKVNDWTLAMVNNGEKYRIAERNAKQKNLRLWKNFVDNTANRQSSSFTAIVTRILGSDLIQIENLKTGLEQKVQLSSVRGPKRQRNDSGLEVGYYSEAVEFLRSRLVGKTVQVIVDYVKPAEGEYESRTCVTILNGDQNISEALISRGLAQVIRHKKDDDNRSSNYDSLLISEERAQSSSKGVWSTKDLPTIRISDVSESMAKARQFLPFLQKAGEMGGIVEFCASGSRFRILVPSQSARITLVLGGIRVPRAGGGVGSKAEPYGPEALNFVNKHVLQRDITFSAENVDKTGGIIGTIWINKKNVAALLLEQGLGYIHDYSASQSPHATALYEAESVAKSAKIGVWKDFDPNASVDEVSSSMESLFVDKKTVVVSEFSKDSIYIQVMGPEIKKLEKMMQTFSKAYDNSALPLVNPKIGDYCAAKFSADNQWYRAQILSISAPKVTVRYIDYGNSEQLLLSSLCQLQVSHSIKNLPAQAIKVELAHLEFPNDDDDSAFHKAQSLLSNSMFFVKIVDKSNVLLYPTGSQTSINEELLKEGICYLKPSSVAFAREAHQKKLKSGLKLDLLNEKDDLDILIEAQEEAKRNHLNIWRYGDFQDDD